MREISSPLDGISSPFASRRFTPSLLFRANEPGYVYDLNDVTTLFKDTAGTQPVTAAGDAVALKLSKERGNSFSKRRNLLRFSENIDSGVWLKGSSGTGVVPVVTGNFGIDPNGNLTADRVQLSSGASGNSEVFQLSSLTVGQIYTYSVWLKSNTTTVTVTLFTCSSASNVVVTTDWQRFTLTRTATIVSDTVRIAKRDVWASTGDADLLMWGAQLDLASDATEYQQTLDLPTSWVGNHATQSDLTKRPLYSLLPANGVRNLANGSADVGNTTYWPASATQNGITGTKVGSGIDTDGLPYVDTRYQGTTTNTFLALAYTFSPHSINAASIGQTYTASAVCKLLSGSLSGITFFVGVVELNSSNAYLTETSSAQVPAATDTLLTATRTLNQATVANTRTAVSMTFLVGTVIDVTIRVKGLQFEQGSTRTAYQYNYAATNIAEPPFNQVGALLYDGINDFMVTSAIDFSGTDEVFLCHGVRKTSDAARGVLVELGNTGALQAFLIDAPGSVPASQRYRFATGGTTAVVPESALGLAPESAVISGQGKISTDTAILRRNGVQVSTSAGDQGTGNYSNAAIYFGGRGGTSLFFKGYEFSSLCRGAATNASQIVGSEGWVRARTAGAY